MAPRALPTSGIDHVVLYCRDPARSRAFYTDVLGMAVHFESTGYVFLDCGDQRLALFKADGEPTNRRELNHLAFNTPASYDETLAALKAHGIEVTSRAGDPRCIYFSDPDGHRLQIVVAEAS